MVNIQRNGRYITRNASWFKREVVWDEKDAEHSLEEEEEDMACEPPSRMDEGEVQSGVVPPGSGASQVPMNPAMGCQENLSAGVRVTTCPPARLPANDSEILFDFF
ncbi:hypothetical protein NDU88_007780 [Pleurodeles waltl]|uniref:Uncharacterized protein n=1 Tax=Pleurodeles waltl TaxID=8319 RepID=A0AAV7RV22_PLEWA|nr:hypothetical protein NDU88_007780 [Pleurodeles waltl]